MQMNSPSVMFQDYALFPWLTVQDNIGFGLRNGTPGKGLSSREINDRVQAHIDLVRLRGSESKYPHRFRGACASASRLPVCLPMVRTCC